MNRGKEAHMKHKKILDAALVAALLLASIPELTDAELPHTPELALIAPAELSEDDPAPRQ